MPPPDSATELTASPATATKLIEITFFICFTLLLECVKYLTRLLTIHPISLYHQTLNFRLGSTPVVKPLIILAATKRPVTGCRFNRSMQQLPHKQKSMPPTLLMVVSRVTQIKAVGVAAVHWMPPADSIPPYPPFSPGYWYLDGCEETIEPATIDTEHNSTGGEVFKPC